MKIAIGSDHAGFDMKTALIPFLQAKGYEVTDYGTQSADSVDYPDFAHPVAEAVEAGEVDFGILTCGTGNGVAITANKHQGIRAALCWAPEIGALVKRHNNANILCLPARFISFEEGKAIFEAYESATFEGGRHQNRINKIGCA